MSSSTETTIEPPKRCWVCFEEDTDDIMSSCDCKGIYEWACRGCLQQWVNKGKQWCKFCQSQYSLMRQVPHHTDHTELLEEMRALLQRRASELLRGDQGAEAGILHIVDDLNHGRVRSLHDQVDQEAAAAAAAVNLNVQQGSGLDTINRQRVSRFQRTGEYYGTTPIFYDIVEDRFVLRPNFVTALDFDPNFMSPQARQELFDFQRRFQEGFQPHYRDDAQPLDRPASLGQPQQQQQQQQVDAAPAQDANALTAEEMNALRERGRQLRRDMAEQQRRALERQQQQQWTPSEGDAPEGFFEEVNRSMFRQTMEEQQAEGDARRERERPFWLNRSPPERGDQGFSVTYNARGQPMELSLTAVPNEGGSQVFSFSTTSDDREELEESRRNVERQYATALDRVSESMRRFVGTNPITREREVLYADTDSVMVREPRRQEESTASDSMRRGAGQERRIAEHFRAITSANSPRGIAPNQLSVNDGFRSYRPMQPYSPSAINDMMEQERQRQRERERQWERQQILEMQQQQLQQLQQQQGLHGLHGHQMQPSPSIRIVTYDMEVSPPREPVPEEGMHRTMTPIFSAGEAPVIPRNRRERRQNVVTEGDRERFNRRQERKRGERRGNRRH